MLPIVLIIGRPNVGKSTFVNKVIKQRRNITLDMPGVTRDISSYPFTWRKKEFFLMDSGGVFFEKESEPTIQSKIEERVEESMKKASKIIFLTDYTQGIDPIDMVIAAKLRPVREKVQVVVNKVDDKEKENYLDDFYKLGLGDPYPLSAINGTGIKPLLDIVTKDFQVSHFQSVFKNANRIAIVGRPNIGKSSLINAIVNDDRVIVADESGTTRDAIDVHFNYQDKTYVFVDTAGMRKRTKVADGIEYYSVMRSQLSIKYSDLVIVLVDATVGLSNQDKKIIRMVLDEKKNLILFVNKWDLCERNEQTQRDLQHIFQETMPQLKNYPIVFGSAKEKIHIGKLFQLMPQLIENSQRRIPTADLNNWLSYTAKQNVPTAKFGKRLKLFYVTQAEKVPPTFVFFVNYCKYVSNDYRQFLEKRLRESFDWLKGIPLILEFKERQREHRPRPPKPQKTKS